MTYSTPTPWTFETATTFWTTWFDSDVEAAGVAEQFQAAEDVILAHQAETFDEAFTQLSVVIDAMTGGGRSDGLDIDVVRRIQRLIREIDHRVPSSEFSRIVLE